MKDCGNYLGCSCMNQLGSNLPVKCVGKLEINQEPCVEPPPSCTMHEQTASKCSLYYFCPKDQCLIRNIICSPTDYCQGDGVCIPSTGQCTYPNLLKGTICDDAVFYTYNDSCDGKGTCKGIVDNCLKYNVQCNQGVADCTFLPGSCQPDTGRCVYQFKPTDTSCDDGRAFTVGDQCQNGLCVGQIVNLCGSADCTPQPWDTCHGVGACIPSTGFCDYPALPNGQPCDDHLPDLRERRPYCIDGVCVGDVYRGSPQYLTVGEGQCVDGLGKRMSAQQGDVGNLNECEQYCTDDNQCKGFSYAFPICTLFGNVRSKASREGWTFLKGDQPPALAIERVLALQLGEPKFVCKRKDWTGDPDFLELGIVHFLVGWWGFSIIFVGILIFYFRVTVFEFMNRGKDRMKSKFDDANEAARRKYLEAKEKAEELKMSRNNRISPEKGGSVGVEMDGEGGEHHGSKDGSGGGGPNDTTNSKGKGKSKKSNRSSRGTTSDGGGEDNDDDLEDEEEDDEEEEDEYESEEERGDGLGEDPNLPPPPQD